jgi:EAL domain-containing protein (putative c-di-GMP-specific phosphodiesterase class I)
MKINWKDVLERAAWTFVEGFLLALPVSFTMGMNGAEWKSALFGAGLAGLSALKTFVLDVIKQQKSK